MSVVELSKAEHAYFVELGRAADDLAAYSRRLEVPTDDPRAVSLMLHNRLTSNRRGFTLLWKESRSLEAAIILRCALECTICLSANHAMREEFYALLLGDLAASLKGQIKLWREDRFEKLVRDGEANLRTILARAPDRPRPFDWPVLADLGGQPQLYGYHKSLSIIASHVTAMSIMRDVVAVNGDGVDLQESWHDVERPKLIRQMAIATVIGMKLHADVIGAAEFLASAQALEARLNELSEGWKNG